MESAGGNYVSINCLTQLPFGKVQEFAPSYTPVPAEKQHVTLMYSKNTSIKDEAIQDVLNSHGGVITAKVLHVSAFDSASDPETCTIVAELSSRELTVIYKKLSAIGLKSSYADFKPHVSMAYNFPRSQKDIALDYLNNLFDHNDLQVSLEGWKIAPIISNWSSVVESIKKLVN
jgi:2'-5' RNA ligase